MEPLSRWYREIRAAFNDISTLRDFIESSGPEGIMPGLTQLFLRPYPLTAAARKSAGSHALNVLEHIGQLVREQYSREISVAEGFSVLCYHLAQTEDFNLDELLSQLRERFRLLDQEVDDIKFWSLGIKQGLSLLCPENHTPNAEALSALLGDERADFLRLLLKAELGSRIESELVPEDVDFWFDELSSIQSGRPTV